MYVKTGHSFTSKIYIVTSSPFIFNYSYEKKQSPNKFSTTTSLRYIRISHPFVMVLSTIIYEVV